MARNNPNTRPEIIEIIKAMPDCISSEICQLMPHVSNQAVYCMIHALKSQGVIEVSGKRRVDKKDGAPHSVNTYRFVEGPAVPVARKMKRKTPTDKGYEARIVELNGKLLELEEWKANAIKRHPDLAVPPVVLKARKIVADEVRAGGDVALANQVMSGLKDTTLMVRVTIKALEEDV